MYKGGTSGRDVAMCVESARNRVDIVVRPLLSHNVVMLRVCLGRYDALPGESRAQAMISHASVCRSASLTPPCARPFAYCAVRLNRTLLYSVEIQLRGRARARPHYLRKEEITGSSRTHQTIRLWNATASPSSGPLFPFCLACSIVTRFLVVLSPPPLRRITFHPVCTGTSPLYLPHMALPTSV